MTYQNIFIFIVERRTDMEHPFKDLLNDEGFLRPRQWPKAAPRREKVFLSWSGPGSSQERAIWVQHVNDGDESTQPIIVDDDEEQEMNFSHWTPIVIVPTDVTRSALGTVQDPIVL